MANFSGDLFLDPDDHIKLTIHRADTIWLRLGNGSTTVVIHDKDVLRRIWSTLDSYFANEGNTREEAERVADTRSETLDELVKMLDPDDGLRSDSTVHDFDPGAIV